MEFSSVTHKVQLNYISTAAFKKGKENAYFWSDNHLSFNISQPASIICITVFAFQVIGNLIAIRIKFELIPNDVSAMYPNVQFWESL